MYCLPIVTNAFKKLDGAIDRLKRKECEKRTRANLSCLFLDCEVTLSFKSLGD